MVYHQRDYYTLEEIEQKAEDERLESEKKQKELYDKLKEQNKDQPPFKEDKWMMVGKYKIGETCLDIYPCQHYIWTSETKCELLYGPEIQNLLEKEGSDLRMVL
jgi:hypothetical protein